MEVGLDYINGCIGTSLDACEVAGLLSRMALTAEPTCEGQAVRVTVPPTRSDVLHACDVMEVGSNPRLVSRTQLYALHPPFLSPAPFFNENMQVELWEASPGSEGLESNAARSGRGS